MNRADITVIGGGPGGYAAAIRSAQLGAKVVMVEMDKPGGTCLNRGCIPTKALVKTAADIKNFKNALAGGILDGTAKINISRVVDEKNRAVETLRSGLVKLLKKNKVNVITAKAKVDRPGRVRLIFPSGEEKDITTEKIIIATGSKNVIPPISGIDLTGVCDSDGILNVKTVPEKLLIIGGGAIGLEFAGIFSGLGTKVTVVEMLSSLAASVDRDISRRFLQLLKRSGVRVFLNAKVQKIEKEGQKLAVTIEHNNSAHKTTDNVRIAVDLVLTAAGRVPAITGVNAGALGLEVDNGAIKVNERMETNVSGIYAAGDCTGGAMLAHVAMAEGAAAAENAAGGNKKVDLNAVPYCIFSYPEVAGVGLGEDEAKMSGREILISKFPYSALGKAVAAGETSGTIKLVADKKTGRLLGGHIMGYAATELVAEITLAVKNGLRAADVADTIHAHPTLAEGIMEAARGIGGKPLHLL